MNNIENRMTKIEIKLESIDKKLDEVPTKAEMDLANRQLVEEMKTDIKKDFVSKERFEPVEKIAYGLVGSAVFTIAYAIYALVIK